MSTVAAPQSWLPSSCCVTWGAGKPWNRGASLFRSPTRVLVKRSPGLADGSKMKIFCARICPAESYFGRGLLEIQRDDFLNVVQDQVGFHAVARWKLEVIAIVIGISAADAVGSQGRRHYRDS